MCLLRQAVALGPELVVDCAVGRGDHAKAFICTGSYVMGVDWGPAKISHERYRHLQTPVERAELEGADLVFSSHTLEHLGSPGEALARFRAWLNPGGWLALAVPPYPQERFHVGHLTVWTPAHLLYNLVCAGWDCRDAQWYTNELDIGVLVQKTEDIDLSGRTGMLTEKGWLQQFLPFEIEHRGNAWLEDNWNQ